MRDASSASRRIWRTTSGDGGRGCGDVIFVHWHDLGRHLTCCGAVGVECPYLISWPPTDTADGGARDSAAVLTGARVRCSPGNIRNVTGLSASPTMARLPARRADVAIADLSDHGYRTVLFGMRSTAPTRPVSWDRHHRRSDSRCDYVVRRAAEWNRRSIGRRRSAVLPRRDSLKRIGPTRRTVSHADPDAIGVPDFLPDTADASGSRRLHGSIASRCGRRLLESVDNAFCRQHVDRIRAPTMVLPFPRQVDACTPRAPGISIHHPPRTCRRNRHPGSVCDGLFSGGHDLTPTLSALLGSPIPAGVDGLSRANRDC